MGLWPSAVDSCDAGAIIEIDRPRVTLVRDERESASAVAGWSRHHLVGGILLHCGSVAPRLRTGRVAGARRPRRPSRFGPIPEPPVRPRAEWVTGVDKRDHRAPSDGTSIGRERPRRALASVVARCR